MTTGTCPDRGARDAPNSRDRRTRLGSPRHLWLPCKTHDPLHAPVGAGSTSVRPILEQWQLRPCPTLSQRGTHGRPCLPRRHAASSSPGNLPAGEPHWGACSALTAVWTHLPLPCGEGMKSRRTVEPSRCASSGAPGGTLSSLLRSGVINDQRACLDGDFVRTHRTTPRRLVLEPLVPANGPTADAESALTSRDPRARPRVVTASLRRLSACGRPKLLSAQIRMSGCLIAARMASGRTLAAWSKLIPSDSR